MKRTIRYHKAKRTTNPYAKIDWDRAAVLFKKPMVNKTKVQKFPPVSNVLQILAAAGAIGLVFAFPGASPAIGALVLGKQSFSRWQTKQTINQLKRQKFVAIKENDDGSTTVKITRQGMVKALTYRLDTLGITKPSRWDKKWRVVIFDIPTKYNRTRDIFRMRLKQLGLYQLQESVYISPYPCFSEVEFLRELYGVAFTIKYLLVERIEDDRSLKIHFELS